MADPNPYLTLGEAARRVGATPKALRIYERRGLLSPGRTAAGWRAYGPQDLARAAEIVALRALDLSLQEVEAALASAPAALEALLSDRRAAHQASIGRLSRALDRLQARRPLGDPPTPGEGADLEAPPTTFALPWPWGGEAYVLEPLKRLTFLTGPLGCGKTRFALHLAEALAGAVFLGLDRGANPVQIADAAMDAHPSLPARIESAMDRLVADGASRSAATVALVAGLEAAWGRVCVVDLVEQGLDQASQLALMIHLRRRGADAAPLVLMTRSNAILDLSAVQPDESIIFCPANHSPPITVRPQVGAFGYEAVASCLASPAVRARTEGMRARMPAGLG